MRKIHILLADDDEMIRLVVRALLEKCSRNLYIKEAKNGGSAIELLSSKEYHFDLLITDLQMPVKSGFEVIEFNSKLKEPTEAIVLSGTLDADDLKKVIRYGIRNIVAKPIDSEKFHAKVKPILVNLGVECAEDSAV